MAIGAVLVAIYGTGGNDDGIPPVRADAVRLSLVATRDLDQVAPCELPAGGTADNAPLVADQQWTRTGGQSCYPTSATTAQCFDATEVPYTVDATGIGWVLPGAGMVNRLTYSTSVNCSTWTCGGSPGVVATVTAPDGTSTATDATSLSASDYLLHGSVSGYGASATLYPRYWVRCYSGILSVRNATGGSTGEWTTSCAAAGSGWYLVHEADGVITTEVAAWAASGTGYGSMQIRGSGATHASIWAPTLTSSRGTGLEVVPTAAPAVDTGTAVWTVDNSSGRYWATGWTLLQSITTISGTCWVVDGTTLRLTGASGSPCAGILYSLEAHP